MEGKSCLLKVNTSQLKLLHSWKQYMKILRNKNNQKSGYEEFGSCDKTATEYFSVELQHCLIMMPHVKVWETYDQMSIIFKTVVSEYYNVDIKHVLANFNFNYTRYVVKNLSNYVFYQFLNWTRCQNLF